MKRIQLEIYYTNTGKVERVWRSGTNPEELRKNEQTARSLAGQSVLVKLVRVIPHKLTGPRPPKKKETSSLEKVYNAIAMYIGTFSTEDAEKLTNENEGWSRR